MRFLLLALLLAPCAAGCKHSSASSSETHTETSTTTESTSSETGNTTTTTVVTEAPGETTTTTEEFAPPAADAPEPEQNSGCGSATASNRAMGCRDGPLAEHPPPATPKLPRHGPLVKRTVTVVKSGGETTQTKQEAVTQAQGASETKAAAQVDTKAQTQEASAPSAGCIGSSWLIGFGVLVFAVALIAGILKFRKAV